jgi:hypothetical protein
MTTQRLLSFASVITLAACGAPRAQAPQPAAMPTTAAAPAPGPLAAEPASTAALAPVVDPTQAQAPVEQGRDSQRERGEGAADDAIRKSDETLAALPDPSTLPRREETPRAGPKVVIRSVGDVNLGRGWPADRAVLPDNDARELFGPFGDELRRADITDGNLETALADAGESHKCGPKSTKCFAFRVPTSFANALKEAGFDVMGIANNHAGDFGMEGRLTTKRALDGVGIKYSGTLGDIATLEVNGLKVGFIAFSTGSDVYSVLDIPMAQKVVAEAKRAHDLVIVAFHAGAEGADAGHVPKTTEKFLGENRGDEYAFAHAVIDAGADLAIGHGPHRVRGVEVYKGRFIAYSLGNFSTYKTFGLTGPLGVTGILEVTLAANGVAVAAQLIPGIIEQPGIPRLDPARQAVKLIRDLSRQDFGNEVFDADGRWLSSQPLAVTPQPATAGRP